MNNRFIIAYKEAAKAKVKYFGPFVSDTIADQCRDRLPRPQIGGYALLKSLQPPAHS